MTIWKNISDPRYFVEHLFYLCKNILVHSVRGHHEFARGFGMALSNLPQLLQKRRAQWRMWKKTDREIFQQFSSQNKNG